MTNPSNYVSQIFEHPEPVRNNSGLLKEQCESEARFVNSPYLTTAEAAAYCRRKPKTILNHHCLGNIRSMPGTRPLLFRREDLDKWLSTARKFHNKFRKK